MVIAEGAHKTGLGLVAQDGGFLRSGEGFVGQPIFRTMVDELVAERNLVENPGIHHVDEGALGIPIGFVQIPNGRIVRPGADGLFGRQFL